MLKNKKKEEEEIKDKNIKNIKYKGKNIDKINH